MGSDSFTSPKDVGNDKEGDGLLRISIFFCLLGQGFSEERVEEGVGFGLGGGELGFQLVAEGHQFIHFGDDAVLFGESGKGKWI